MTYATSNPPALIGQAIAGRRKWEYVSADPIATVNTNGYFTNGEELGMKVNDLLDVVDTNTPTTHLCIVNAVNANGSVDITDGLAVTATDSD